MSAIEGEHLGKATYDLEVSLGEFKRNMREGRGEADQMGVTLDALDGIARITEEALGRIRLSPDQAAESRITAKSILEGVQGISEEAMVAAQLLDKVRITEAQATESSIAGERIKHNVKDIGDEADRTKRKLTEVKIAGGVPGRSGVGVGLFGSGFGRVGLLGTAIGAGVLTAPAAGPAMAGLLAGIPTFIAGIVGAAGTLALALHGVGAAIGGDKKAFDQLQPSAQQFVLTIRSLSGWVDHLREIAGHNLFPGLTEGLHAALSPGTVSAISVAVAQLAHALGLAGAEWGHFFGSAEFQQIFGPLMAAAAIEIGDISSAVLHLFDALGVLARAAIPLTSWITNEIDNGARLAAQWMHAADASGALSGGMNEARTSLTLVLHLLGALFNAVGALGSALYPVSKVAVKDLTDGLNALAGIIHDNQDKIRELVGGALAALVETVKVLVPIIGHVFDMLNSIAHAVGGWEVAFEVVIGGFLALKFASLASSIAGTASKIALIGTDAAVAEGELGGLRSALLGLGAPEVLAALAAVTVAIAGIEFLRAQAKHIASQDGGNFTLNNGQTFGLGAGRVAGTYTGPGSGVDQSTIGTGYSPAAEAMMKAAAGRGQTANAAAMAAAAANPSNMQAGRAKMLAFAKSALGAPYLWGGSGPNGFDCSGLVMWAFANGLNVTLPHLTDAQAAMGVQVDPRKAAIGNVVFTQPGEVEAGVRHSWGHEGLIVGFTKDGQPIIESAPGKGKRVHTTTGFSAFAGGGKFMVRDLAVTDQYSSGSDPFGTPQPFDKNVGKPPKAPVIPVTASHALDLASMNANLAKQLGNVGGTAKRYLENEIADLNVAKRELQKKLGNKNLSAADRAELNRSLTNVENRIRDVHTLIKKAILVTGTDLLPDALVDRLKQLSGQFKADSAYASVLTGDAAEKYQDTLRKNLTDQASTLEQEQASLQRKLASTSGRQKQAVQDELDKVNQQLGDVQDQVLQSLEGVVQTMQSHESSAISSVTSEFDAAFEQKTQEMIDALGRQFFQNGLLTPEETAYQAMLADDRQKQLQDTLANAKTPEERAAAEHAIEEDRASAAATESRRKADEAYTAAVAQLQKQRTALEAAMNADLAKLGDGLLNGTASLSDLTAIADEYGIKLDKETIPDLANLTNATADLEKAFEDLADYIEKITGNSPDHPGSNSASATIESGFGTGTTPVPPGKPPVPIDDLTSWVTASAIRSPDRGSSGISTAALGSVSNRDIVIEVDSRELARVNAEGLARNPQATRLTAKVVSPALATVTSVG